MYKDSRIFQRMSFVLVFLSIWCVIQCRSRPADWHMFLCVPPQHYPYKIVFPIVFLKNQLMDQVLTTGYMLAFQNRIVSPTSCFPGRKMDIQMAFPLIIHLKQTSLSPFIYIISLISITSFVRIFLLLKIMDTINYRSWIRMPRTKVWAAQLKGIEVKEKKYMGG